MNLCALTWPCAPPLQLNCTIATFTKWDREELLLSRSSQNYQISQYDLPFSRNGWLEIETEIGPKRIGIIRVHLEEDAGKMLHDEAGAGKAASST